MVTRPRQEAAEAVERAKRQELQMEAASMGAVFGLVTGGVFGALIALLLKG